MCAISTITFTSCDSDMVETASKGTTNGSIEKNVSEVTAERSFAKILSVAAAKEASLRTFLKHEAQKQFDKDYDVFYPYVKDKEIKPGKTLRDILVECSSEEEIGVIENSAPLLTIMIPDLESFKAFSVNNWDPSLDQIATTYAAGNDNSVFFAEGDSLFSLPAGSLPNFPFLVVKSNERMKVVGSTSSTRGGNAPSSYDFVDPAYDGAKVDQTRAVDIVEKNLEVAPEEKPYLKKEQLDTRCIEAYNLAKNNNHLIDREYIYYNLSPQNPSNGRLDPYVREKLYMFRISPSKYNQLIDEKLGEDPKLQTVYYKKSHPSQEQMVKDLWTNGAFEIVFQSYKGGNGLVETKPISVKGSDLFYVDKFNVKYSHHTMFRHSKWWYSAIPDNLKGKWVDLSSMDLYLTDAWDLYNSPISYYIKIIERDNGTLKSTKESYTTSFVAKSEFGVSGGNDKVKVNLGFSGQLTTQQTYEVSYQYKDENDDLGSLLLNFRDPVIVSNEYATSKGYQMYSLNTGAIDIVIAPKRIR